MNRLLVIGGASFDRLHLPDQTVDSVGGAGMYTAMAARRFGAQVALFGPRPDPCPEGLQPVAEILAAGVERVQTADGKPVTDGLVLTEKMRPARRNDRPVLVVEPQDDFWYPIKLD